MLDITLGTGDIAVHKNREKRNKTNPAFMGHSFQWDSDWSTSGRLTSSSGPIELPLGWGHRVQPGGWKLNQGPELSVEFEADCPQSHLAQKISTYSWVGSSKASAHHSGTRPPLGPAGHLSQESPQIISLLPSVFNSGFDMHCSLSHPLLCWVKPDLIFLCFLSISPPWVNAFQGDMGQAFLPWCRPSCLGAGSERSRAGQWQHTQRTNYILGLLSPQMVSSEAVTLLCTAGPGCGSLPEQGLVKVPSSFIVLQMRMVTTCTVKVLSCFLFDSHCDQLW